MNEFKTGIPLEPLTPDAFAELEMGVHDALETYSNVHRGSGQNSMVSSYLYDQAREIVLDYLRLKKRKFTVIFCTPRIAAALQAKLDPKDYRCLSDHQLGLFFGIRAMAVKRSALRKRIPVQSGGGTTRLISRDWVIWSGAPDRFEAGTPAIINVIAFAKALKLIQQYGNDIFRNTPAEKLTVADLLYRDELEKFNGKDLLAELRKTIIGRGIQVPTMEGLRPFINFDNGASTPTFGPVWNTFRLAWRQPVQVRQEIIREVKSICSQSLGVPQEGYDILFTSNTTESINLVAASLGRESGGETETVVLNTFLEHSSNDLPWRTVPGCSLIRLTVDDEGFVDLDELENILMAYNQKCLYGKKRIRMVALSGASNVLGICNNLSEISRIAHRYGTHLLVDAAQLVAHRKVNMADEGIDYLAFSGHKVYAPFGSGVLAVRKGMLNFSAAEMQAIRMSGEENAGGIAALGKVMLLLQRIGMDVIGEEEQALTARALRGMTGIEGMTVYGISDPGSPRFGNKLGVIVFGMKGMFSNKVTEELTLRSGIGMRYGCHCAHIIVKRLLKVSPSLERFQWLILTLFPQAKLPGLARISLGIENSEEEVDTFILTLKKISGKAVTGQDSLPSSAGGQAVLSKKEVKKQMQDFTAARAAKVYSISG